MESNILPEVWIQVKGYAGLYECSTYGNIKSLDKIIPATKNRGQFLKKGQLLSLNCLSPDGYIFITLYGGTPKKFPKNLHHIIYYSFNPDQEPVKGFEIDHDDNDKLNNKPSNLKLIPTRLNSIKRSLQYPKTSIYTGVSWDKKKNKWFSCIRINKKTVSLGHYDEEIHAAKAYQNKLAEM